MKRLPLTPSKLLASSSRATIIRLNLRGLATTPILPPRVQPQTRPRWTLTCKEPLWGSTEMVEAIADCFPVFPETLLPRYFSCDWSNWTGTYWFFVPEKWHNLSVAQVTLMLSFKLCCTPLRPLAFTRAVDYVFLAAAGKDYILWDGDLERLIRFGSHFKDDEEFMRFVARRFLSDLPRMGVVEYARDVSKEEWHRVHEEQCVLRARAVAEGRVEGRVKFEES
ncbi:hypothetical protein MVEN_01579300 [Mycena venus]|uniref:Uncharacterized protein n=1 Tax=Mycena venus TaxID=2733690 RepID=A0A8H6XPJ7_9AGAR|nr:hypothetical protein MVEN_01579300 [Mycena venus]